MDFSVFALNPRIAASVAEAGFVTPTPIQQQAIPEVLAGRDVLGLAQTGTGKTAAFALPILHHLLKGPRGRVRVLVIAPTRELAEQIHDDFARFGTQTGLRCVTVYGGVGFNPQVQKLRQGAEIVIACPGRLLDHLQQKTINLSQLEVLVLDEADRMLDMGFLPDIRRILKQLPAVRQTLMFSATMADEIRALCHQVLRRPVTVQVDLAAPAHSVSHALYPVAQHLKPELLLALLRQTDTEAVLVFTRTKHRAKRLGLLLQKAGYRAASLQGNLSQNRRQEALNGFRAGTHQILVATDIAARGIDVSQISHVINFDMPDTPDAYIHRIGRTGRAACSGDAYTLATDEDRAMVRAIERLLGHPLERRTLADFDYQAAAPRPEPRSVRPGSSARPRVVPRSRSSASSPSSQPEGVRRRNASVGVTGAGPGGARASTAVVSVKRVGQAAPEVVQSATAPDEAHRTRRRRRRGSCRGQTQAAVRQGADR